jgi:hypothetical protein
MPSLKSLMTGAWVSAMIALIPFAITIFTERWFRFGVAFEIGLLCTVICFVIAGWGLTAYGRKGLRLLWPIIPASSSLLIILAGLVNCLLRDACTV